MKKLDKDRDYGTISGDSFGRAYEQDGEFFDGAGNHIPNEEIEQANAEQLAKEATDRAKAIQDASVEANKLAEAAKSKALRDKNTAATKAATAKGSKK